jgi:SAM-dependent methyltransferase
MLLRVSDALDRLTVLADLADEQTGVLGMSVPSSEPVEVCEFGNPVLLTDNHAVSQLVPHVRDAVFSLYQSFPRTVSFRGTSVSWSPWDFPRVWCPSIDTVFLAGALDRLLDKDTRSFAELGTGSGFLTKFALERLPNLERAVATDISIDAIRCAHSTTRETANRDRLSLLNVDSTSERLGLAGRFDVITTNPPYVPRPAARNDNPYEGLDLLAKLAREADKILAPGGRIIVNVSSVAGNDWQSWFLDEGFEISAGESLRVPLKVNTITGQLSPESKEWLNYLLEKDTLQSEPDYGDASGYRFWHVLRIYEIRRSGE